MNYSVHLLPHAEQDIDQILAWLNARSPKGAAAWYRRWLEVVTFLEESADGCGLAPEDEDHEESIRQFIFKTRRGRPYRALLAIRESRVYVLHVRGPGQDIIERVQFQFP